MHAASSWPRDSLPWVLINKKWGDSVEGELTSLCTTIIEYNPIKLNSFSDTYSLFAVNCQSLKSKRASLFWKFIIIIWSRFFVGTESWLSSEIANDEIFPYGCTIYRRDHPDGYGGVFFSCCSSYTSISIISGVASLDLMLGHTLYNKPCLATCMLFHICIYIWLLSKKCTAWLTIAKLRSVKAWGVASTNA